MTNLGVVLVVDTVKQRIIDGSVEVWHGVLLGLTFLVLTVFFALYTRGGGKGYTKMPGSGGGAPSDACRAGGSGGAARKSATSFCQTAAVSAKAAKAISTPP